MRTQALLLIAVGMGMFALPAFLWALAYVATWVQFLRLLWG